MSPTVGLEKLAVIVAVIVSRTASLPPFKQRFSSSKLTGRIFWRLISNGCGMHCVALA